MMSAVNAGAGPEETVDYDPFAGGELARVVPATEPQREIWLADQLGRDASLAFNESVSMRLKGPLDVDALRASLQGLLDRHDALRANLGPDGDTLCVLGQVAVELPVFDHSASGPDERAVAVRNHQRRAVETPFSLQHDRLFRTELLRLSDDEHVLVLTAHHIVCDGWSWWVLTRELGALYAQYTGKPGASLPATEDFAEYALAEAMHPASAGHAEDEAYWLSRFSGEIPVLDLPTDRPRPARRSFASEREDYVLGADLVAAIRKLGARRGASLFATLLASFAGLLSRLANQSQVVVGIPAAGQSVDGHDHLVGHCVNALPLLFDLDLAQPVAKAIDDVQGTLLDALDHQRYTYSTLLGKLRIGRDPSRLPLISVMFNIDQALDQEASVFPGLALEFSSNPRSFENFELFINAVQEHGELRLECQYNRDLFDTSTIRHWMGYWKTMLEAMVVGDGQALGRLPLLAETERRLVLEKLNDTQVDYPRDRCIHELIEAQVERTPQAVAVVHEGSTLSYTGLNKAANQLAHHLRGMGVRPDDRVAVCVERGLDMVVGLLAVLKAGAAYVPVDPQYPADRLAYMLQDCKPTALLTQQALSAMLTGLDATVAQLVLDAPGPVWSTQPETNPEPASAGLTANHLAYVIYTSGSTGMPKGAMNEHRGVVNRLLWMQDEYRLDAGDTVLQKTPFSFDVSVWEFFLPLLSGARLAMARVEGHKDPAYLAGTIRAQRITTMHFVPSMLHAFLEQCDAAACAGLKRVICSGEALPASLVASFRQKLPQVELHNLYGPTEAAVDVTAWNCSAAAAGASVPIGRPIANTRIYILDALGQPVPMGVAGELFIGGVQVGRGYLNRDELTAERFLPDPFVREAGARMYKTGDLGRWRADGNIEYLGRNDFQVKLRGFRIELGEIEKNLAAHASVAQTVVIARQDRPGDVRLVAYVVARPGSQVDPAALAKHLKTMLPEYMVPQHFVAMDVIPLSPNGKIERKALPVPDLLGQRAEDRVAPRNELERGVAEAMEQILGVPGIGIHDDFFALGGHSLLAAQLTTRLNRDLGSNLSLRSVFDGPTVARLAAIIEAVSGEAPTRMPIVRRERQDRAPLSLMQDRLRLMEQYNPGSVSYNTPSGHRLTGPLDVAKLDQAFRLLAQRQTVLRTTIGIENGEPVQVIHEGIDPGLSQVIDLSQLPADRREKEVARRMRALVEIPFSDLSKAPLFCARLFKFGDQEHVLFFMPHHIIWDGWSFDLLYSDIAEIYGALVEDREPVLPELPVTYGDYSAWHNEWVQGPGYAKQVAFWRERLGGPNSQGGRPQALPTDKPRKRGMSGSSKSCKIIVPEELTVALHASSRSLDVTLFVTLLSAYYVLLAHTAGQRDMVIGTPVRGRNSSEVEDLMGYFTNLLPLRVEIDPEQSFADLVRDVRGVVLDSFASPDIRLEDLTRELSLRSEGGGAMLYQALFSFQDVRQRVVRWGNLDHQRIEVFQPGATEDLGLWFVEDGKGMTGGLIYNADILEDDSILRLRRRYLNLLDAVAADPRQTVATLTANCDHDDGQHADDPGDIAGANEPRTEEDNDMPSAAASATPPMIESRERYLLDMWSELFGTEVKLSDNFFDLGGNSMLAVQMAERVARDTGVRIKLMRLAAQSAGEIAAELPVDVTPAGNTGIGGKLMRNVKRLFGG